MTKLTNGKHYNKFNKIVNEDFKDMHNFHCANSYIYSINKNDDYRNIVIEGTIYKYENKNYYTISMTYDDKQTFSFKKFENPNDARNYIQTLAISWIKRNEKWTKLSGNIPFLKEEVK